MTQAAKPDVPELGATSRPRVLIRKFAPWVLAAGTVAFLLTRYSLADIGEAALRGSWEWLLPWAAAAAIASLLFMATADWIVVIATVREGRAEPVKWWKMVRGKAGTAVLAALNQSVGQGMYGVWIARSLAVPPWKTAGLVLYIMLSDLTALSIVATVAIYGLTTVDLSGLGMITILAPAGGAALAVAALFGPRFLPYVINKPKLFAPWADVKPIQWAGSVLLRIGAVAGGMVAIWAAAQSFGLDIPFAVMLSTLPVLYLVASLPINVAGLGPVQLLWLSFYEPYADGADILAFQILFRQVMSLMFILRGLPFIKMVTEEVARGASDDDDDDDSDDDDDVEPRGTSEP